MKNMALDCISRPVIPVSVEVFYEDGRPYIKYLGTTELDNGLKVQVEIPKMDLALTEIIREEDAYYGTGGARVLVTQNIYTRHNQWCQIKTLERTCSKKDLEQELGYKLNIKE